MNENSFYLKLEFVQDDIIFRNHFEISHLVGTQNNRFCNDSIKHVYHCTFLVSIFCLKIKSCRLPPSLLIKYMLDNDWQNTFANVSSLLRWDWVWLICLWLSVFSAEQSVWDQMWMKFLEVDNERGQSQSRREAEDEPTSVCLASVRNNVTVVTKFWWTEKNNNTWVDREVSRMLNNRLYAKLCVAGLEKPESSVGEWIISGTRWAFEVSGCQPSKPDGKEEKAESDLAKGKNFLTGPRNIPNSVGGVSTWEWGEHLFLDAGRLPPGWDQDKWLSRFPVYPMSRFLGFCFISMSMEVEIESKPSRSGPTSRGDSISDWDLGQA